MKINSILLDSDFIFALQTQNDANHTKALKLEKVISKLNYEICYLNFVKHEIATLISRRIGQSEAIMTVNSLANFKEIFVNEDLEKEVWQTFKSYSKKNISFVDCANLTIATKFDFKIASFDQFYPSEFLL